MPDNDKPEKIVITTNGFNADSFQLSLSASYGLSQAGERASFEISSTIEVKDASGNVIARLGPQSDMLRRQDETVDPPRNTPVALRPQVIAWADRTFSGTAVVTARTEIRNGGTVVAGAQAERSDTIEIGDGRTDPGPG